MIPLAEAQERVLAALRAAKPANTGIDEALGRVLAETVTARDDIPPFANTAMDGYAVHAADLAGASPEHPARLRVVGTLAAGAAFEGTVGQGEALRIMTGAPFPNGADAVAIVETTTTDGDTVLISAPVEQGAQIRAAGGDVVAGQEVFPAGTVLGPGHLGVLASVGRLEVSVVPAPVVGVLSTGDELVEGDVPLRPGQIRESNRHALLGLLRRDGYVGVDLGIAPDDAEVIRARILDGVGSCDAVLTSGGVSMGDFDLVKKVLDEIGEMDWMQVAIRPARPFAFGTVGTTPVFGLPGNPVSSMVSYELLARPALRRLAGHADGALRRRSVPAVVDDDSCNPRPDGRTVYVRVKASVEADGRWHVRSAGSQGSHQLTAMAHADALAVVPDRQGVPAGGTVQILVLDA
ncbi:MAG: molybdopterin molybdotransferase MoeA [Acidimicrobiaceae bacterium]|nr:molybdopterin molybdotransferase MoeA [Acidimicrobiaceae bacterium]